MRDNLSILVPVFNAFPEACRCLDSVAQHTPSATRIIIIDDGSSDGDFKNYYLSRSNFQSNFEFHRNSNNLGFVQTCNFGMLNLADKDDVILLNSDTLVTRNWTQKLKRAAYSKAKIGTVTPLTNNGEICSTPKVMSDQVAPPGFSLDRFASLVEKVGEGDYPVLPTCVGFCVYLRRELLDAVGGFDSKSFPKGYGEENDLSLRGQAAGFIDILDDCTYIYHKGAASFCTEREKLVAQARAVISERHPEYFDRVEAFVRENRLHDVQARIWNALILKRSANSFCNVLHILHNGPVTPRNHTIGGSELHVQDLIEHVPSVCHWSLTPTCDRYFLSAHLGRDFNRDWELDRSNTPLDAIIQPRFFDIVHVHHTIGFDRDELSSALLSHGKYVISVHDHFLACPRIYLTKPNFEVCNGFECTTACGYSQEFIDSFRLLSGNLFKHARSTVFFSKFSNNIIEETVPNEGKKILIAHGSKCSSRKGKRIAKVQPISEGQALKVAFIGEIPLHKGAAKISELTKYGSLNSGRPIEWHLFGRLHSECSGRLIDHGPYSQHEIVEKLKSTGVHLVVFPNIAPETYSYTVDEAWAAEIPVIVGLKGAACERVQRSEAGWVLQDESATGIISLLNEIASDWSSYLRVKKAVSRIRLVPVFREGRIYQNLYRSLVPRFPVDAIDIINYFQPGSTRCTKRSRKSWIAKMIFLWHRLRAKFFFYSSTD
ncbi:MAG: glycosyltransferase, partial [Bdellovibrionales bacterium]|nr:glycosyltransferase [Bdellovibrionales bacterium]